MLVVKRREGQWLDITHNSGDRMRIRVYNIRGRGPGQLDLAFEDPDHRFKIQRPERPRPVEPATTATVGVDLVGEGPRGDD